MSASSQSLAALTLTQAADLLRRREVTSTEITQAVLDRIDAHDGRVKAYVTVMRDQGLSAAATADERFARREIASPLQGIPITLKDLYNTAGVRTTSSSKVRENYVPKQDATVTRRLKEAGAVIIGKTVTHEFAYGVVSAPTRNPWNLDCIPGGSSGGTGAAVAADMCLAGFGTDTGGSIRIPASVNGIAGLKPTFGRVSKAGVAALSWSLDHTGPMGKSVADLAVLLNHVSGHDPRDPTTAAVAVPDFTADLQRGVRGMRIGVPANYYFEKIDPEVEGAVRAAIQALHDAGAHLQEVTIPELSFALALEFAIFCPEASSYHQVSLRRQPQDYGADVRLALEAGELYLATHYLKAQRARSLIKQAFQRTFGAIDVLLAPTLPATAARADQETFTLPGGEEPVLIAYVRTSCPANLSGLPALSVPCGFSAAGLPIGLQIIGRPFDEQTVLRVGQAYEGLTTWHTRKPPL